LEAIFVTESGNGGGDNSPKGWFDMVKSIFIGKDGFKFLSLFIITISLVFLSTVVFMKAQQVKVNVPKGELTINSKDGNIAIQSGKIQNAVLMISAAGGREGDFKPWVKTGINVAVKDTIKIEASGSVHTSLKQLIEIAKTDSNGQPWVGPKGSSSQNRDWDDRTKHLRLVPNAPYGALVAAILNDEGNVKDNRATTNGFEVKTKGELLLAVNDIKLDKDSKDYYAIPLKNSDKYYEGKLIEIEKSKLLEDQLEKADEIVKKWPKDVQMKKAKDLFSKYEKTWDKIYKDGNWTVWFDDNVGDFFVSITKTQP
jgi:hypothetical protein